jgi:hypothetical protein
MPIGKESDEIEVSPESLSIEASIGRLRLIQDSLDIWEVHRSSAVAV